MKAALSVIATSLIGLVSASFNLSLYAQTETCGTTPLYHFTNLAAGGVCNSLFADDNSTVYGRTANYDADPDCALTIYDNAECSGNGYSTPYENCYYLGGSIIRGVSCS